MATDFSVVLEDRPGMLANVAETLGRAGVNIQGGCGVPAGGEGVVHILVDDVNAVRVALQGAGITIRAEQPVLVLPIEDRPGALGKVARKLADAGININLFYLSTRGQLVLGVDNLDKARSVVETT